MNRSARSVDAMYLELEKIALSPKTIESAYVARKAATQSLPEQFRASAESRTKKQVGRISAMADQKAFGLADRAKKALSTQPLNRARKVADRAARADKVSRTAAKMWNDPQAFSP